MKLEQLVIGHTKIMTAKSPTRVSDQYSDIRRKICRFWMAKYGSDARIYLYEKKFKISNYPPPSQPFSDTSLLHH